MTPKRLLKNQGQSMVEFAFTSIFFFTFLIALTDMTRICYCWVSLQYAVNEAARDNSLGNDAAGTAQAIAHNLKIPLQDVRLFDYATGAPVEGSGNALAFIRVRVTDTVILTPVSDMILELMGHRGSSYNVFAETVIRNEPFN